MVTKVMDYLLGILAGIEDAKCDVDVNLETPVVAFCIDGTNTEHLHTGERILTVRWRVPTDGNP